MKEAIEDLEWPNGPVVLAVQRDPQRLTMRATGISGSLEVRWSAHLCSLGHLCYAAGIVQLWESLLCSWNHLGLAERGSSHTSHACQHLKHAYAQIELPANELMGFKATQPSVTFLYAYKNLRAAFSNIPTAARGGEAGSISTKVCGGVRGPCACATLCANPGQVTCRFISKRRQALVKSGQPPTTPRLNSLKPGSNYTTGQHRREWAAQGDTHDVNTGARRRRRRQRGGRLRLWQLNGHAGITPRRQPHDGNTGAHAYVRQGVPWPLRWWAGTALPWRLRKCACEGRLCSAASLASPDLQKQVLPDLHPSIHHPPSTRATGRHA